MTITCFYVGNKWEVSNRLAKKTHKVLASGKLLAAAAPVATGSTDAFLKIMNAVLGIADWLCWGVIVFAGASWMLGNRTKAIEHIIGGSFGYLIVRHASDIRDFLRGL